MSHQIFLMYFQNISSLYLFFMKYLFSSYSAQIQPIRLCKLVLDTLKTECPTLQKTIASEYFKQKKLETALNVIFSH